MPLIKSLGRAWLNDRCPGASPHPWFVIARLSIEAFGASSNRGSMKGRNASGGAVAVSSAALLAFVMLGCQRADDPPMAPPRGIHLASPAASTDDSGAPPAPDGAPSGASPGPRPAVYPGELASIAAEASIYEEPRWGAHRLGYLRAGAVVRRGAEPVASGPRCPDGWYAVEPRGFVCVGPLATLDVQHPVAVAAARAPGRDGLPYPYVLSRHPTPPLYARLPSFAEQLRFEPDLRDHLASGATPPALAPDALPAWLLAGPSLSLGNAWHDPDRVLLGQARPRSGFALLATVDHRGRRFGVTTGLEVIPLDRTHLVEESRFSGVALDGAHPLPLAFVRRPGAFRVVDGARGLSPGGAIGFRDAVAVTGETRRIESTTYLVARDGSLVRSSDVVVVRPPRHLPAWASDGVKWIEVSIPRQSLVAYEGTAAVYATLVSTGVGGTGDPEETHATVQGAFRIYEKHVTVTMAGREAADPFDLRDVPFVQYFHQGYALHGAYWHDDFGRPHSHGCVNLSPIDAAWLFRWTDPRLPPGWHGAMAHEGTIVWVHD
jgi:L,D-transpeptidase catalytic domain